eukprot:3784731-Ditylum_brightwellii.AAC.1
MEKSNHYASSLCAMWTLDITSFSVHAKSVDGYNIVVINKCNTVLPEILTMPIQSLQDFLQHKDE